MIIKRWLAAGFMLLLTARLFAQFPPAAGQAGTTALHKDSSAFIGWASGCTVVRGFQNIADTTLGKTTAGDSSMATGMAGQGGVVSLGDGGVATLTFDYAITDGPGWDFAVFENSFDGTFLELAFVEVSSDGIQYFRFPATSLTDTSVQVPSFGTLDATKINNLAGKYRMNYGTPFDLHELDTIPGLDVSAVTHVRITDVVGSIGSSFATRDYEGRKINDPWPTPFPQGGFDLDAVGVIHSQAESVDEIHQATILVSPNPAANYINFALPSDLTNNSATVSIADITGRTHIVTDNISCPAESKTCHIDISGLANGVYVVCVQIHDQMYHSTFLIRH